MNMRTGVTTFFMVVALATHHDLNSMNAGRRIIQAVRRNPVKGVVGAAVAYEEWKNRKKEHFVYDVPSNDIQAVTNSLKAMNVGDRGSPTAKHIATYHQWQYPHKHSGEPDIQEVITDLMNDDYTWVSSPEAYVCEPTLESMIDDILVGKYRETPFVGLPLNRKQREGLKNAVLHFISQ